VKSGNRHYYGRNLKRGLLGLGLPLSRKEEGEELSVSLKTARGRLRSFALTVIYLSVGVIVLPMLITAWDLNSVECLENLEDLSRLNIGL